MDTKELKERLFSLQDVKYRDFQRKLIPNIPPERIIGVRTPALKKLAAEMSGGAEQFLSELAHEYFEEDQLHAFIISRMKDFDECIRQVEIFLPYVNNWETTDQMTVKIFKKHTSELLEHIKVWLACGKTYTIRYGIGCLMKYYLDDIFSTDYLDMAAEVESGEYYVNMMRAWFFAEALAKQYDAALPYIESHKLDEWTHRKAIQKAVESFRITDEQKEYLKTLK